MKMAEEGRNGGCESIFVSSVLPRSSNRYAKSINRVNAMLEQTCLTNGYVFLDHDEVSKRHICGDGIHPNAKGTTILKMNILSCFSGFDSRRTTFYNDCISACS